MQRRILRDKKSCTPGVRFTIHFDGTLTLLKNLLIDGEITVELFDGIQSTLKLDDGIWNEMQCIRTKKESSMR